MQKIEVESLDAVQWRLAHKFASLIIRVRPLVCASDNYILDQLWAVWVGEHQALLPTFQAAVNAIPTLEDQIHYEIDLVEMTPEDRDVVCEKITILLNPEAL